MKTMRSCLAAAALACVCLFQSGCATTLLLDYIEDADGSTGRRGRIERVERAYLKDNTLVLDVKRRSSWIGGIIVGETRVLPLEQVTQVHTPIPVKRTRWFAVAGRKATILPLVRRDLSYNESAGWFEVSREIMLEQEPPVLIWGRIGSDGSGHSVWGALMTEENGVRKTTPIRLPCGFAMDYLGTLQSSTVVLLPVTVAWDVVTLPVQAVGLVIILSQLDLDYN